MLASEALGCTLYAVASGAAWSNAASSSRAACSTACRSHMFRGGAVMTPRSLSASHDGATLAACRPAAARANNAVNESFEACQPT